MITGSQSLAAIHKKEDDIGLFNCLHGLITDVVGNGVVLIINTAGVHQYKWMLLPAYTGIMTIPGDSGRRIDNSIPAPGDPVEQG